MFSTFFPVTDSLFLSIFFFFDQGTIPGMVYDSERSYPVHGCHPHKLNFQPQPIKKLVKLEAVAHNLAV